MKKNPFLESLYKNAGYLVVVLVSLVYIASSLVMISKTGKSILEIIGSGFLSLIVGILINSAFRSIGIRRGEEDERTTSTNQLHASAVEEIIPYIDMLDDYCEAENARLIRRIRTRILAKVGLKYESCFDEDGTVKELKIDTSATKKQQRALKRAYKRAVFVKIKHLSASALTSDGVEYDNPYDFGKSKRDFSKGKGVYDALVRIIMAVIFGYFGVSLVSEINLALIIWNTLQIIMYITGGVIGMYSAYMFIVDDYRMSIIKKIDQLQRFKLYALDKERK
jgi:hypothetical protein